MSRNRVTDFEVTLQKYLPDQSPDLFKKSMVVTAENPYLTISPVKKLNVSSACKKKKTPTPYTKKSAQKSNKCKQSALEVLNRNIHRETPSRVEQSDALSVQSSPFLDFDLLT